MQSSNSEIVRKIRDVPNSEIVRELRAIRQELKELREMLTPKQKSVISFDINNDAVSNIVFGGGGQLFSPDQ